MPIARRLVASSFGAAFVPLRLVPPSPLKEYVRAGLVAVTRTPSFESLVHEGETVVKVGVDASEVRALSRAAGPRGRVVLLGVAPSAVAAIRDAMRTAPFPNAVVLARSDVDAVLEELGLDRIEILGIATGQDPEAVLAGAERSLGSLGVRVLVSGGGETAARSLEGRGLQVVRTRSGGPRTGAADDIYAFRP